MRQALKATVARPADRAARDGFLSARRSLARDILGLAATEREADPATRARQFLADLVQTGVLDAPLDPADAEILAALRPKRWMDLLAGMLLAPAWRWSRAPRLADVPDWLSPDFARWVWAAPQGFLQQGDTEAYAAFMLDRMNELAQWGDRNRGSAAVRTNLETFVGQHSAIPLYFNDQNLRRHFEVRARILAHFYRDAEPFFREAYPRDGRRLRIGFINRHFGSQTETYSTLPLFEHLDPSQFEVVLFALSDRGSPLEAYCRSRAAEHYLLSGYYEQQQATLRAAGLDVLVFGTNVTPMVNEITRLAMHRFAPLQVMNNSAPVTTGMPTIDLYVSGALTETADAADHFTERLALLPGPAHAFNYEADQTPATTSWSREQFGLPTDALVFVTAANYFKIIPEMQHAWARLLKAVPGSYLLVHPFNPNWSHTYPVDRFEASITAVFAQHGLAADRLRLSRGQLPSRSDVKELLRVGDVYLDSFPFSGVNSLVDPLEIGLPVVVQEGSSFRSRMASALLRSLQLEELVATSEPAYQALAQRLALDADYRQRLAARVREAMDAHPLFLDRLAASDAFGSLVLQAYDEVAEQGAAAFRSNRRPIVPEPVDVTQALAAGEAALAAGDDTAALGHARRILAASPNHAPARRLAGRALLVRGAATRACDYLLSALNGNEGDPSAWFDAARGLRAAGQTPQAIEALEVALKMDATCSEGWQMMADLARAAGASELASEAESIIAALAAR